MTRTGENVRRKPVETAGRPRLHQARDDIAPDSPLDDGTVVAQYGGTKVYVNLGDVTRAVGPYVLGPYGWRVVFENKKELTSEEIR
mgnify:CR=1 FL=1